MLKDTEGVSDGEGSEEGQRDDAEFLAQGEDLDLPEEDSDDEQLKDDSDSDLEDYY